MKKKREPRTTKCKWCGILFTYTPKTDTQRKKFCTPKCALTHLKKKRRGRF